MRGSSLRGVAGECTLTQVEGMMSSRELRRGRCFGVARAEGSEGASAG